MTCNLHYFDRCGKMSHPTTEESTSLSFGVARDSAHSLAPMEGQLSSYYGKKKIYIYIY